MKRSSKHIAVFGCQGAIGQALVHHINQHYPENIVQAISRHAMGMDTDNLIHHAIDYADEDELSRLAQKIMEYRELDLIVIAIGMLHDETVFPEKSLSDIDPNNFAKVLHVNTILPSLIAKHFLPCLKKETKSVCAFLSARVGSISDNHLGGWYAYRSSKAALNMFIKTASIEMKRTHKQAIIVGLHPGTVDSNLSKPFQKNVKSEKLFSADESAAHMIDVIKKLSSSDSGGCFAWDGQKIAP